MADVHSTQALQLPQTKNVARRRRLLEGARLLGGAVLIGLACACVSSVLVDQAEEHGYDLSWPGSEVEPAQGSEDHGRGGAVGHGLNSSADAGCCA